MTFHNPDERLFWMQVYLAAVHVQDVDAKDAADEAVEALRARTPRMLQFYDPDHPNTIYNVPSDVPVDEALLKPYEPTTAAAPLSNGPKLTVEQAAAAIQVRSDNWQHLSDAAYQQQSSMADHELSEFFPRPVKVHVR